MTIGLSMFAAQYWGKGDKGAVERVFAYVMKVTAAVSFLFFLVGMCVPASGIVLLGLLTAFVLKLPVLAVYFIVNLDEIVKLPAVYRHYKKYKWVKDLTVGKGMEGTE